jgi:hypothetical protein
MSLKLKVLGTLFGGLVLAMSAPVASAYDVVYTLGNETLCATGTVNSNPAFEAAAAACGGTTEVYKQNVGEEPVDTGSFAGSYTTTFANTPDDPADATIAYNGAPALAIECSATEKCFLGVKDGNADPTYYIFDISDWDGTSSIVMTGFWADSKGAISHVSIFSSGDGIIDDDDIPEPASLALVGIALLAAGAVRRRRTS